LLFGLLALSGLAGYLYYRMRNRRPAAIEES